jgi:hypothetical protein
MVINVNEIGLYCVNASICSFFNEMNHNSQFIMFYFLLHEEYLASDEHTTRLHSLT